LFLVLFLLRALLRKPWLAAVAFVALAVGLRMLQGGPGLPFTANAIRFALFTIIYSGIVFITLRLGFFAFVATIFSVDGLMAFFLTTDFGAWYGQSSWMIVVLLSAIALWGFKLALAGQSVFGPAPPARPASA
jgi:hypothetical protein